MTTTSTTTTDNWLEQWNLWRTERDAAATAPHGLASVTGTHWLDEEPQAIDSLPGTWAAVDGNVVGTGPDQFQVTLAPGAKQDIGDLSVAALVRAGKVAVRVFDPQATTRATLSGIAAFEPDESWVLDGLLEPDDQELEIEHIDGFVGAKGTATVRVTINGELRSLTGISSPDGGAQIVFADSTNGTETQRFRFLNVAPADADGHVVVDFNRAFLPPCTFTDHYLCPLPPQNNRLDFPVRAGESVLIRTDAN
jgi:uncharacterized protein (DUF1684 family)